MPRTAKELSPEELKQYHLRLNQHSKTGIR